VSARLDSFAGGHIAALVAAGVNRVSLGVQSSSIAKRIRGPSSQPADRADDLRRLRAAGIANST